MKRVQKEATADLRLSSEKKRSTYAFGSYDPTYQITRLPYNVFTPGKLLTIPVPPATGLTYEGYDCTGTTPTIATPATYGTRDDSKLTLLGVPGATDGQIVQGATGTTYDNISVHLTGYFRAPQSGSYVFSVVSDDGFQMTINGSSVISPTGAMKSTPISADTTPVSMTAGSYYPINALWANGGGLAKLFITQMKVNGTNIMTTVPFYSCLYKTIPDQLPPPQL
jgi:hypothetical protein